MQKVPLVLVATALSLASIAAQSPRAVHVTTLPGTMGSFHYHPDALVWAAFLKGDKKTLVGGSAVAQASSTLKTTNDLRLILSNEKTGETHSVVVAEEALGNNQYRYWGLDITGQWHKSPTLKVAVNTRPTANFNGEHIASVIGGSSMVVFNQWQRQWVSFPVLGSGSVVTNGVNVMALKTGTTLVGYSAFGQAVKILRSVAANSVFLAGSIPNNSACLCYKIGSKEVAFFSGFLQTWTKLKLKVQVTAKFTFVEYGEHCCAIQDGNTLYVYSAMTGKVHAQTFADLNAVLNGEYKIDDSCCVFLDKKAKPSTGYFFSCRTGQFTSQRITSAAKVHIDAEWGMIEDGSKYYYTSAARFGAVVKTLDLGTEKVLTDKLGVRTGISTDDGMFLIVTDKAAYGYTAVLNQISRRTLTRRPIRWSGQDWYAFYHETDAVHALGLRDGKWYTLKAKAASDKVQDDDGVIVVQAGAKNWYFGMEARGWRSVTANGSNQIDAFLTEVGGFVANSTQRGSDLSYYSAMTDEILRYSTNVTFKAADFLGTADVVYAIDRTSNKIVTLTAYSDITPQEATPIAFRTSPAKPAIRWVLRGQPNHAWWMNFSLRRGSDLRIPGVIGDLRLDPTTLFVNVLNGTFDARGVQQVTTVVPSGILGYLQMLTFRQNGSAVTNLGLSQFYGIMIQ